MYGLFISKLAVLRNTEGFLDGIPNYTWTPITFPRTDPLTGEPAIWTPARVDVTFVRAGKDMPLVVEAGRAADRLAVIWLRPDDGSLVRAGDRLVCVGGPITGTYSVDQFPDQLADAVSLHHIEIGAREVSQALALPGAS